MAVVSILLRQWFLLPQSSSYWNCQHQWLNESFLPPWNISHLVFRLQTPLVFFPSNFSFSVSIDASSSTLSLGMGGTQGSSGLFLYLGIWASFMISLSLCCAVLTRSCLTLCNSLECSLAGCSFHKDSLSKNTGVGCHFLLQEIFPSQGLNPGLILFC